MTAPGYDGLAKPAGGFPDGYSYAAARYGATSSASAAAAYLRLSRPPARVTVRTRVARALRRAADALCPCGEG